MLEMNDIPKEDLDPAVRAFLARLDSEDVPLLEKSIDLMRKIIAAGQVAKWLTICLFGTVLAVTTFWEAIQKLVGLVRNATH